MSTTTIYRLSCDGPSCPATTVIEKITEVPEDWTRIGSADHLADWREGGRLPGRNGRTRKDPRTTWDIHSGEFTLHVCPGHADAFAGHLPETTGTNTNKHGNRAVTISCSCGGFRARVYDLITIWSGEPDFADAPTRAPERQWWRHLPEELREYAGRARRGGAS